MPDWVVDFETKSRVDLSSTNAYKYASDASTDILCMGYSLVGGGNRGLWVPGEPFPFQDDWPNHVFWASNAEFELSCWLNVCVLNYDWPTIRPEQIHCIQARANYGGLPRKHETLCRALGFGEMGKDEEGHRNMLDLCKPKIANANAELVGCVWVGGEFDENVAKHERNFLYCLQDVDSEVFAMKYLPELPPFERELWLVNQAVNQRGIPIDRKLCQNIRTMVTAEKATFADKLQELTGGQVIDTNDLHGMKRWLKSIAYPVSSLNEDAVITIVNDPATPPVIKKVLQIRQLSRDSAVGKFPAMLNHADQDDRCRGAHVYYEAGTGRFQGKGVNFLNLKRLDEPNIPTNLVLAEEISAANEFQLDDIYARLQATEQGVIPSLAELVRFGVCAGEGKQLVVRDYSAIEFRMLHWLANDQPTLDMIQRFDEGVGDEPYKIYGAKLAQIDIKDVTKKERSSGKLFLLQCGYCAGGAKVQSSAPIYGLSLSLDEATNLAQLYKRTFPLVKKLWYRYQDAAVKAVQTGEPSSVNGKVHFYMEGPTFVIELPSGRKISYYDPTIEEGTYGPEIECLNTQTKTCSRRRVGFATITENIDQGASRDVMAGHLVELVNRHNLPVVLHIYDEIVAEVNEPQSERAAKLMGQVMTRAPKWAAGLPLAVSGGCAKRYVK